MQIFSFYFQIIVTPSFYVAPQLKIPVKYIEDCGCKVTKCENIQGVVNTFAIQSVSGVQVCYFVIRQHAPQREAKRCWV